MSKIAERLLKMKNMIFPAKGNTLESENTFQSDDEISRVQKFKKQYIPKYSRVATRVADKYKIFPHVREDYHSDYQEFRKKARNLLIANGMEKLFTPRKKIMYTQPETLTFEEKERLFARGHSSREIKTFYENLEEIKQIASSSSYSPTPVDALTSALYSIFDDEGKYTLISCRDQVDISPGVLSRFKYQISQGKLYRRNFQYLSSFPRYNIPIYSIGNEIIDSETINDALESITSSKEEIPCSTRMRRLIHLSNILERNPGERWSATAIKLRQNLPSVETIIHELESGKLEKFVELEESRKNDYIEVLKSSNYPHICVYSSWWQQVEPIYKALEEEYRESGSEVKATLKEKRKNYYASRLEQLQECIERCKKLDCYER